MWFQGVQYMHCRTQSVDNAKSLDFVRTLFILYLFSFLYIYLVDCPSDLDIDFVVAGASIFHKHMPSFSFTLSIVNYFQRLKDVFAMGNYNINTFLANIKRPQRSCGGNGMDENPTLGEISGEKFYSWMRFPGESYSGVRFPGEILFRDKIIWTTGIRVTLPQGWFIFWGDLTWGKFYQQHRDLM